MSWHYLVSEEKVAVPVMGSTVSWVTAFNLHAFLGTMGQIIGILSGLSSFGWVVYQIWHERHRK